MIARETLAALALGAVALIVRLLWPDDGTLYFAMLVMIWSIFALGYDISFGLTGLLSFGHAAFFGMGAYAAAWAMQRGGAGFGTGLAAAMLMGAVLALAFATLATRVSGLFFALMTLMLGELVSLIMTTRLRGLSGGVDGLPGVPRPDWFGVDFFENRHFYWVVLALFLVTLLACGLLRRSPLGQALLAVRQNPVRAGQLGLDVALHRLIAVTVSGAFSGLAGALLAGLMMYAGPQTLGWRISGDVVIMAVLGGSGTLIGPVLGVVLVEALREWLSLYTQHTYGLIGLIIILCTLYLPRGIAGLWKARA
ncbi:MAG: branched-chain amino acid ABC transporter permease [Ferrovibrionaceae bacterium]